MKKWEYVAGEGTNDSLKDKEIVPVQIQRKKNELQKVKNNWVWCNSQVSI